MGRVGCCEKNGVRKGSWTAEEDKKLVSYITKYGHWNWRLLPKFAGLARCGKSWRFRWLNYLRPDIKRGHFTKQEQDTIITLHQKLGNRWSMIAAELSGRTDNEIKNYWHTNLKKRFEHKSDCRTKIEEVKDLESNNEEPPSPLLDCKKPTLEMKGGPLLSSRTESDDEGATNKQEILVKQDDDDEFPFLEDLTECAKFLTEPYMIHNSYELFQHFSFMDDDADL